MHDFHSIARDSFLFTDLQSIEGLTILQGVSSRAWRCTALREPPEGQRGYSKQQLTIVEHSPNNQVISRSWMAVIRSLPRSELPPRFQDLHFVEKHRIPPDIILSCAARLDEGAHSESKTDGRLFATLPLPTTISIPIHISASFILAEDRRSIRFDEDGQRNDESRMNRWLFVDMLPDVYLFLLSECSKLSTRSLPRLWPSSGRDPLAVIASNAFYNSLPQCTWAACQDLLGNCLTPGEAIFLCTNCPPTIRKLLKSVLRPSHVVVPAEADQNEIIARVPGLRILDEDVLKQYILDNKEQVKTLMLNSQVPLQDIQAVVQYLGANRLRGLPLLPLSTSERVLQTFEPRTSPTYIGPFKGDPWCLFPQERFAASSVRLASQGDQLLYSQLGLSEFDTQAIVDLVRQRLGQSAARTMSQADTAWIQKFWEWPSLRNYFSVEKIKELPELPFLPTTTPGHHVSFARAKFDDVIVMTELDLQLQPILNNMGATCLQLSHFPDYLRTLAGRLLDNRLSLKVFLSYLRTRGLSSVSQLFGVLGQDESSSTLR